MRKLRRHLIPMRGRPWWDHPVFSPVVAFLAVTLFGFGVIGFWIEHRSELAKGGKGVDDSWDWTIPIYQAVQLFLLNSGEGGSNWALYAARISAMALFAVISFAVIGRVWRNAAAYFCHRSSHTVVCGMGGIGVQLVEDLLIQKSSRKRVTIIERDEANPYTATARDGGAALVIGDATRVDVLDEAYVDRAERIFAVTGDDGTNMEIVAEIGRRVAEAKIAEPPAIYLHLADPNFATAYPNFIRLGNREKPLPITVFNVPHNAATQVVTRQLWPFMPKSSDEVSHFVIVGFGVMGQMLALRLGQLAHFPNRKKIRLTIADRDVMPAGRAFVSRYERFTAWRYRCDVDDPTRQSIELGVQSFEDARDQWSDRQDKIPAAMTSDDPHAVDFVVNAQFVDLPGDAGSETFVRSLAEQFSLPGVKPVIFICGQRDHDNFEQATRLRERLAWQGVAETPCFVWLPNQPALAQALAVEKKMYSFGRCQDAASLNVIANEDREYLAKPFYEYYRRFGQYGQRRDSPLSPWEGLAEWERESNRQAYDHLHIKLATLGLRLVRSSNLDGQRPVELPEIDEETQKVLAAMEHHRWLAERLLSGWRHAPTTDRERRLHKELVPTDKISSPLLAKLDLDQLRVVLSEVTSGGFELVTLADDSEN